MNTRTTSSPGEKNYKGDGWDEASKTHQFDMRKARNNNEDLRGYRFRWQEHPWAREPRFQRLIVRAHNPSGRQIEVAILSSDPNRDRRSVIGAMFNRWLQENDFGYMDRHVGITSKGDPCRLKTNCLMKTATIWTLNKAV